MSLLSALPLPFFSLQREKGFSRYANLAGEVFAHHVKHLPVVRLGNFPHLVFAIPSAVGQGASEGNEPFIVLFTSGARAGYCKGYTVREGAFACFPYRRFLALALAFFLARTTLSHMVGSPHDSTSGTVNLTARPLERQVSPFQKITFFLIR